MATSGNRSGKPNPAKKRAGTKAKPPVASSDVADSTLDAATEQAEPAVMEQAESAVAEQEAPVDADLIVEATSADDATAIMDLTTAPTEEPSVGTELALNDAVALSDDTVPRMTAAPLAPADGAPALAPVEQPVTPVAWAAAPRKRRGRKALAWLSIPAAAVLILGIVASFVLIAPGTAVAGVPVGGMTASAAADAISARLADTTVTITANGTEAHLTAAELGASVNAKELADRVFEDHPMWKVGDWFNVRKEAKVTVDEATAAAALRDALPAAYSEPSDAEIAFNEKSGKYAVKAGTDGQGVSIPAVQAALQDAFTAGKASFSTAATLVPIEPNATDSLANATVDKLNKAVDKAGFYVGEDRAVAVDAKTVASWLSVSSDSSGTFGISVDTAAIQKVVDSLPENINREAVNATVITDPGGQVLRTETEGQTGRTLQSTEGIASAYATQLSEGNGKFALNVKETEFTTTTFARSIDVNLTDQTTRLYENGKLVNSYLISSGKKGYDSATGEFRIFAKVVIQDMRGEDNLTGEDYLTEDVPWVSYYNGDEALHGAYWHNNFGNVMSHGCINMPVSAAQYVFDWAPVGTPVTVHY